MKFEVTGMGWGVYDVSIPYRLNEIKTGISIGVNLGFVSIPYRLNEMAYYL